MPLRVKIVSTAAELADLRGLWTDLWERSPDATPFQAPEWLLPWWRHLGRGRLCAPALWDGPRLVGLLPGFVSRYFGLPLFRWGLLGTGNSDYLDGLLDARVAEDGWEVLCAGLVHTLPASHFLDLQQLRAISPLLTHPMTEGLRDDCREQEVTPHLPLPPTLEQFHAGLGKRLRDNVRYNRRRLEREGGEIHTADAAALSRSLDALFEWHQTRWRKRRLPGVFASERVRRFHREAAAGLLDRGWLRLHTLELRGEPRAALYVFVCRERAYYYAGGFDPELSRLSPGSTLTGFAMEDALARGARVFDFLRGDEPYKYAWGAENRVNYRRLIWRPGTVGGWAPGLVGWELGVERKVKEWARRWG